MIRVFAASCLAIALLSATGLSTSAQEALLDTVRQGEQREARLRQRASRPAAQTDFLRLPENSPADFGARPSTRAQYVRGLRGLQKRGNTAVPVRTQSSTGRTGAVATGSLTSPVFPPRQPNDGSIASQLNRRESVPDYSPGLPPVTIAPRIRRGEADPYAPDGLRLGNINVLPFVGVSGGYDSNPLASSGKVKGAAFVQGEAGVSAQSDWSRHSFNADLRGTYTDYINNSNANRPEISARVGGVYNISRDTDFDAETHARIASETVSDINLPAGVQQRPNTYSYGASSALTQRFGRASLSLRGLVDRSTYDSANLGATTVDQSDRNQNVYALRLRAGYELTPGITPFVDATVDTRQYDLTIDRNGFRRESTGLTGRVGTSFDLTSTLTGEIAAGYSNRRFEDSRLKDLNAPVLEASLIWSISPLTAFRLRATSDLQDTVTAGSSGIFNRRIAADIEHALLRNVTLGATAEARQEETQNSNLTQETYTAGVRADYKLSKSVVLRSSYTFQRLSSSSPGSGYSSHIVLFGIRLQR